MKLRLAVLALLLGLLAWGGWQEWQVHQQTAAGLRRLTARVSPWLKVDAPQWSAHFWHRGSATNVILAPQGTFHADLGLPFGYQASVAEVKITDWGTGPTGDLTHVAGTFRGLALPAPPAGDHAPYTLAATPLPRLSELGYRTITLDGIFDLEIPTSPDGTTHLRARAVDPAFAGFTLDCRAGNAGKILDADYEPVVPGACTLALEDKGVFGSLREALAARERLGIADFEAVMFTRMDKAAATAEWNWSAPDRQAAREFVHDPTRLVLTLEPPGETPIARWKAYRLGDLPTLLGLHLTTDRAAVPTLAGLPPMPAPSTSGAAPSAGTGSPGTGQN